MCEHQFYATSNKLHVLTTRTQLFSVEVLQSIRGFWFYGENWCSRGLNDLLKISVQFGSMTTGQGHVPLSHIRYILKSSRVIFLNESFVEFRSTDSVTLSLKLKHLAPWTVIIVVADILESIFAHCILCNEGSGNCLFLPWESTFCLTMTWSRVFVLLIKYGIHFGCSSN